MHGKPYSLKEFFVDKWANYVVNNNDWSQMQAKFINAQIQNAKKVKLTKEQVSKIRE
ncbi:Uncharacterised protein [uncultured archaeon]|nr:Uncharacterised protein [uncultured archaeon]